MTPTMALGEGLVGRAGEFAQLAHALDGARAGVGATVFVEGAAGIGKTSLLAVARQKAAASGMRVLAGRGSPLEHEFPMGVVRQCFEPAVRGDGDLFRGAAGRARSAVAQAPEDKPGAPEAVLHGLFWLTANLAAESPVALVIDDAQWADEASLRFAAYLALRVDALPVALLVAVRSGEGESVALRAICDSPAARIVALAGLAEDEVEEVLRARAGGPIDATFVRACSDATGGNPFLLGELLSALVAEGVPFTAVGATRVSETTSPSVARQVSAVIDALGPAERALARAAAVLGDDVGVDLAAELAGLAVEDAIPAAAALTSAGLLADCVPLRFRHPVLATAARATLSAADRAAGHVRAAELLRARAAGPERVALHLLHTPSVADPGVVAELRFAATLAVRRGAPTAAVALLRRALAEPPPSTELAELLLELGTIEYAIGSGQQAAEHLEAADGASRDPGLQAKALLVLQLTREWGGVEGMRRLGPRFAEAVRRVEPVDRELALRLRASLLAFPVLGAGDLSGARDLAARLAGATPGEAILLSSLAFVLTWADASAAEVAELGERSIVQAEAIIADGAMTELVAGTLLVLRWADRLDAARRLLDGAVASAQQRGSTTDYVIALSQRAAVHRRAGRLGESEADARSAVAARPDLRWWYVGHTYAALVGTLTDQGRLDDAERELARLPADETSDSPAHISLILERMRLRSARGEYAAALSDWTEAVRRASAVRGLSPAWIDDMAVAADVCSALGDPSAAQALRDEGLALAKRWGTPGALAVALRARGDHVGAIEHARRSPAELELARALVAHGAQLRRDSERVAAREPLREGYEVARRCGAATLADFARAELRATGVRLRREALSGRDALTASERRIAELAATGASNAEIAQSQFLTVKTVEMHLTRAYRKLGVTGRGELERALA
jgi:DNA-binding CsgD family transcriptional regulator